MKQVPKKDVELNGIKYSINVDIYSSHCRFIVNNEESSFTLPLILLENISDYKSKAKEAIKEYIERETTRRAFREWDGSL